MPEPNDFKIDELRDSHDRFFGRAPVRGWLKPIHVDFHRPTCRDLLEGKVTLDPSGPTDLDFEIYTPWAAPPPSAGYVKPRRSVFEQFLTLGSASDTAIHDFASRFGPLMIFCRSESSKKGTTEHIHEHSEVWTYFARCMKSLLRIAANIHADRRQDAADWDAIGTCPFRVSIAKERIKDADVLNPVAFQPEETWSAMAYFITEGEHRDRAMWARLLNGLLQLGRTRPCVIWEGSGTAALPRMTFAAPTLLSYLALQSCLTALKQDALAVCTYCRLEYQPLRAPKTGQRNFCPNCRKTGAPMRIAQRAHRARVRGTS